MLPNVKTQIIIQQPNWSLPSNLAPLWLTMSVLFH